MRGAEAGSKTNENAEHNGHERLDSDPLVRLGCVLDKEPGNLGVLLERERDAELGVPERSWKGTNRLRQTRPVQSDRRIKPRFPDPLVSAVSHGHAAHLPLRELEVGKVKRHRQCNEDDGSIRGGNTLTALVTISLAISVSSSFLRWSSPGSIRA